MIKVSDKFLEKLCEIIRLSGKSGGQIVRLFNNYGFKDIYNPNTFSSEIQFIEERLAILNSQWRIGEFISDLMNPVNSNETGLEFYKKFVPLDLSLQKEELKLVETNSGVKLVWLDVYEQFNRDFKTSFLELRWRMSNPISSFILDTLYLTKRTINWTVVFISQLSRFSFGAIGTAFIWLIVTILFEPSFEPLLKSYTILISDFFKNLPL